MPGSWAAARYGREAAGGIIIVRTISSSFDDIEVGKDTIDDPLRLRDNYFQGEAVFAEESPEKKPAYVQTIDKGMTLNEAYLNYLNIRDSWRNSIEFYAEAQDYFASRQASKEVANTIISNIDEVFREDVNALRLLAYKYEENGAVQNAHEVYRKTPL